MADILLDLKVQGTQDVLGAERALNKVAVGAKRLASEMDKGRLTTQALFKGNNQLIGILTKAGFAYKDARSAVFDLTKALRENNKAQEEAADMNKWFAAQRRRMAMMEESRRMEERAAAEQQRNASREIADQRRVEQSYKNLRMAMDPVYASRMRLKQAADTLRAAEQKGIITREQAIAQLREYRAAQVQAAAATQGSTRRIGQNSTMLQQFGYQAGDFIVQVQSGTNAFVAFGQQATQVAGTLTLLQGSIGGISFLALGAGLSVVIPLLTAAAAAFMRTRQSADEAADGVDRFESALSSARSEISDMRQELRFLQSGLENTFQLSFTDNITKAREELELAREELARVRFGDVLESGLVQALPPILAGIINTDEKRVAAAEERVRLAEAELVAAEAIFELNQSSAQQTEREVSKAEELLENIQQQVYEQRALFGLTGDALREAENRLEIERLYKEMLEAGIEPLSEQWNEAVRLTQEFQSNRDAVEETNRESEALEATLSRISGMDMSITDKVLALAGALGIAVDEAKSLASEMSLFSTTGNIGLLGQLSGEELLPPEVYTGIRPRTRPEGIDFGYNPPSRGGGGGGGGGVPEFVSKIISSDLQKAIEEAAELTREYEKEVKLLDTALENGLISQQEYNAYLVDAQEAYNQAADAATNYEDILLKMANTTSDALGDAMMSIVDGTKSASDAFGDMTQIILKKAFELLVINPILNSIFGGVSGFNMLPSLVPQANGGVWNNGSQVTAFATGGVVGSPTFFPMANGGVGLMGEAGPEAIMPLKRGKSGRLGVEVSGEQGNVTINQTFAFSANGDDSVKKIIAQEAPKIAALTQKQMLDARRRGGVVRDTFA